jgi:FkbM family methyltransferase
MFYSQYKQDEYLEHKVFKGFKNGVFVDVGAHDGLTINNTLFFERQHNWSGINIEPLPNVYQKLAQNRPNCINLNYAVSSETGMADFVCNEGYTEMLSGLASQYDSRHHMRRERENRKKGSTTRIIQVQTKRLEDIFQAHDIRHVHYLSIDVEGAELDVIRSINFDKVYIDVIEFECNYPDTAPPIVEYLQTKGYQLLGEKHPDIFMIHRDSMF